MSENVLRGTHIHNKEYKIKLLCNCIKAKLAKILQQNGYKNAQQQDKTTFCLVMKNAYKQFLQILSQS